MTENIETRCYPQREELRVVEAGGKPTKVSGMAVPINQLSGDLGGFRERFLPGSLTDSVRSASDKRADVEHDHRMLLARTSKGTLEFREEGGAVGAVVTMPGTARGLDAVEDVRNGNLDAMSISFRTIEDRWVTEGGEEVREVVKAELTGVALTAFPAYPQTAGEVALRSMEAHKQEQEPEVDDTEILRKRTELAEAEGG